MIKRTSIKAPGLSACLAVGVLIATASFSGCVPMDGTPPDGNGDMNGDGGGSGNGDDTSMDVPGQPLTTFTTTSFTGSGRCSVCHNELTDEGGEDVSIANDWRATMMANAARDPYFLASVAGEVAHAPELRETIEGVCAKCHMPMARTQAVANGATSLIFGDGFASAANDLHAAAFDGVSCTLCHQVQGDFLDDPEASFSGGYTINTDATAPDRPIFGPFSDPQLPEVMQSAVGYTPTYSDHIGEAGLCATCHTLFTPTLDDNGNIVGMLPEQTPFLEWRHSEFGDGVGPDETCQHCHMPVADSPAVITAVPVGLDPRTPFYQHLFVGGNVFMLRLLKDNVDDLGLTASTAQFRDAVQRTTQFLQTQTATLNIVSLSLDGDTLTAIVELENLAGHKFPTSFPSRRAWIYLTVTDAGGATVFESGAPQTDARVTGDDADTDPATFEPHHDLITGEDQVQVYQAIMADVNDEVTYTLLRGAKYAKDNRILPRGFDKTTAIPDVAVYGQAADDDNFTAGSDEVTYRIPVTGSAGPFTVTARLLYQSISFRFADDLLEVDDEEVENFDELYEPADKTPSTIDSDTRTVP